MKISAKTRNALIPCATIVPVIAVLLYFCMAIEREPLTPDEMLEKSKWSREELVDGVSRCLSPQAHRGKRREVLTHLKKHMDKYSNDERRKIRTEAMCKAMNNSLDQLRAVDSDTRKKMIDVIQKRAEKNYKKVLKMSQKDKEKIKKRLNSDEGRAIQAEANRIMTSRLTPDERRDFAPITKIWLKTLDRL
tara:strand:- start:431 stop:1003 length:573 start_codon:yes stop_codon:yes gene_type:complete